MRLILSFGLAAVAVALPSASASPAPSAQAAPASSHTVYGVAEDATKYAQDGGASLYPLMRNARLGVTRWTVRPGTTDELFAARALPVAVANGIRVVASVHTERAAEHDPASFCSWLEGLARRFYPGIKDYIVWNEPNTRKFWTPQKDDAGTILSAAAYMELLTRCYAALKGVAADIQVIGFGLSPRASTPASSAPIPFLLKAGEWWRANGGGTIPFDAVAIHPYPNPNNASDAPEVGYADPNNYGIPNIDRVKRALRTAFGTTKPIVVDEVAWQVDTSALSGYTGTENVKVVDETTQADYLHRMIQKYFACDPDIAMVLLFHLIDERERDGRNPSDPSQFISGGWQSGLFDVFLRARASVAAVADAIAAGCQGGATVSPDEQFAARKTKIQKRIDVLQAKVKGLAKAKRMKPNVAKIYLGVLARLEKNLPSARLPGQLDAMEKTLARMVKRIKASTLPPRRRP